MTAESTVARSLKLLYGSVMRLTESFSDLATVDSAVMYCDDCMEQFCLCINLSN